MDAIDMSLGNYWDGYVENSPSGFEKHITTCPVADILKQGTGDLYPVARCAWPRGCLRGESRRKFSARRNHDQR